MSNGVDTEEMAHDEPSHLDLHRLQILLSLPVAVKELTMNVAGQRHWSA